MKRKNDLNAKVSTIVGNGCILDGSFTIAGSARIDGTINGDVKAEGLLILGEHSKINGDVSATSAIVGGEVLGNIKVLEKVEATEKAKIFGDIKTSILVIDENAIFQGKCNMNQEIPEKVSSEKKEKPVKKVKKSAKAAIAEALKEVEAENQKEEVLDDKEEK